MNRAGTRKRQLKVGDKVRRRLVFLSGQFQQLDETLMLNLFFADFLTKMLPSPNPLFKSNSSVSDEGASDTSVYNDSTASSPGADEEGEFLEEVFDSVNIGDLNQTPVYKHQTNSTKGTVVL